MLLLCTYVDSSRWASAIEPLLYPCGVGFYRPFSYRKEYFVPEQLADQLADPLQIKGLLQTPSWNDAIFGIRFLTAGAPDFRPFFIPLRRVRLVSCEKADELNVRFTLGDFVAPTLSQGDQQYRLPRLDLTPLVGNVGDVKLFFQLGDMQKQEARNWEFTPNFPHEFWDAFLGSLPDVASQRLGGTVILRLDALKVRGEAAPMHPSLVDRGRSVGGYLLREGTTYDIRLYYKRLVQKGKDVLPVEYFFRLSNPTEEIQASRRNIPIIGNYRADALWIQPQMGRPGPVELAFEPARDDRPSQIVDQTAARMIGLKIPVLIKAKLFTIPRYVNVSLFLLSVAGILLSLRVYFYHSPADTTKRLLELLLAALASLAITSLKDIFVQRH